MTKLYLTIDEVAQYLSIGRSSVYRRVADGTLPKPIKIGNLARFKASEVETALMKLSTPE
jgi:excisionase family DNA binding protein